ncbi:hypothetical protein [Acinetobacter pseudolwoffii]|uniref:hypothetical protein n=1 Tax=Acinetobacter pseudolwoffii TaxID=2053287 RepID=UPI0021E41DEE|nr:hypothetical protein [Acinetobacter pseudolwoffii]
MLENQLRNHDAFSVATLIYARLRRVSGRVIDAIYLAENTDYAQHVIQLAEQTQDPELSRLIGRLNMVLDIPETGQDSQIESAHPIQQEGLISVEPDEDDIYRAQVSHRYIGALR